jgi:carboxypeptidase family protein
MLLTTLLLSVTLQASQIVPQAAPRDAPPRERAGTAAIRGRVVAADTGVPIRRAIVTLMVMQPSQPSPPRNVATDANGRFEFAALPSGSYRLRAMPTPYRAQYLGSAFGGRRPGDMGRTIDLAEGQQIEQADIALFRGGTIPGRVTDEFGDPVTRAMVYASRVMPGSTNFQRTGNSVQTDDLGRFRLFGLEPGQYVVGAESRGMGGPVQQVEGESEGFAPTFYPSAASEREAALIRVSGSGDAGEVEIQLIRTRTFRITGTVMDSRGQIVANPNLMLVRATGASGFTTTGGTMMNTGDGKFTIRDVVPGDYRLIVRPMYMGPPSAQQAPAKRPEYATIPLSVTSNIDDLAIITQPGVSITGRVAFAEGTPQVLPTVRISAQPGERMMSFGPSPSTTTGTDGTFTLNDLIGPLLIRGGAAGGRSGSSGYTLKAVMLGGTDITDTPVEFKAEHSKHLEVVLTSRASTLEGAVTQDNGEPANDVMVLLIPEDKASWRMGSPRMRMTAPQKEGRFTANQVLAGRYHVIAVPREGFYLSSDTGPEFFEALVKEATSVTIGEDEKRTVDLRVVKVAR